jgi:hypothetical protein
LLERLLIQKGSVEKFLRGRISLNGGVFTPPFGLERNEDCLGLHFGSIYSFQMPFLIITISSKLADVRGEKCIMQIGRTSIKCLLKNGLRLKSDCENVSKKGCKDPLPVRRCAKTDNVDSSSEFNHGLGVPIWKRVFSAARFHSSWDSAQAAEICLCCLSIR